MEAKERARELNSTDWEQHSARSSFEHSTVLNCEARSPAKWLYSTSPSRGYSSSSAVLPYIPVQSSIPPLLTLFGTAAPHTV